MKDQELQDKLLQLLDETLKWLALPTNDFAWSSWQDSRAAIEELSQYQQEFLHGNFTSLPQLKTLFAPTGPIQEVSLSSGWAEEFLKLAARFDHLLAVFQTRS